MHERIYYNVMDKSMGIDTGLPIRQDVEPRPKPTYYRFDIPINERADFIEKAQVFQTLLERVNVLRYWTSQPVDTVTKEPAETPVSKAKERIQTIFGIARRADVLCGKVGGLTDEPRTLNEKIEDLKEIDASNETFKVLVGNIIDTGFETDDQKAPFKEQLNDIPDANIKNVFLTHLQEHLKSSVNEPGYWEMRADRELAAKDGRVVEIFIPQNINRLNKNFDALIHDIKSPLVGVDGFFKLMDHKLKRGISVVGVDDPVKMLPGKLGEAGKIIDNTPQELLRGIETEDVAVGALLSKIEKESDKIKNNPAFSKHVKIHIAIDEQVKDMKVVVPSKSFDKFLSNAGTNWEKSQNGAVLENVKTAEDPMHYMVSIKYKKDKDGEIITNERGLRIVQMIVAGDGRPFKGSIGEAILKNGFQRGLGDQAEGLHSQGIGMAGVAQEFSEIDANVFGANIDSAGNLIYGDPLPPSVGAIVGSASVLELVEAE